jgi:UDP-glucose 4-epimerase
VRLLLTGATGFIGQAVLDRACQEHEVVAVARSPPPHDAAGNPAWLRADLTSRRLQRMLPTDVDVIVHLAQSRWSRDFPRRAIDMVEVNVSATARLLDYAWRCGAKRFVFASTATLYRRSHRPLAEDAPLDCADGYPATKRAAEVLIGGYGGLLSCWILRLFTVYGPGQRDRLIPHLLERVRRMEPIAIDGRRGLLLSPIHVSDAVDALLAAASSDTDEPRTLNVGGNEALGISDLVTTIGELTEHLPTLIPGEAHEPGGYVADRRAFSRRFASVPQPRGFREGMASLLASDKPA